MTAIPHPVLFNLGGKDYYLVRFTRENLTEIFKHRDVKECLKESGHIPADVCAGDEVLTHPKIKESIQITEHGGWIGLFGTFSSSRSNDNEKVAFFDKNGTFWRFHQDDENYGNVPHPVLCCK
jgi:hypothetical protein